jgi:hypothetical protein
MKKYLILISFLIASVHLMAQKTDANPNKKEGSKKAAAGNAADSLLNSLSTDNTNEPVAIFRSSRLVLSQTTETVKKNNLNFLVSHRFGDFAGKNGGGQTYFGLDAVADVYLGFEYGLTNNLNIDIGRSTIGGLADLELKYAILHQTTNGSPLAITVIGEGGVRPYGYVTYSTFADRVSYFAQALFARKFGSILSLQVAPSYVINNQPYPTVPGNEESFFAVSGTAVIKISKRMGFIIDYAHPFSSYRQNNASFTDPLGFGLEIETGGHVFTINVTNSRAVNEINYLNDTQSKYTSGQFRVGFTISRMFDFNSQKKADK